MTYKTFLLKANHSLKKPIKDDQRDFKVKAYIVIMDMIAEGDSIPPPKGSKCVRTQAQFEAIF